MDLLLKESWRIVRREIRQKMTQKDLSAKTGIYSDAGKEKNVDK